MYKRLPFIVQLVMVWLLGILLAILSITALEYIATSFGWNLEWSYLGVVILCALLAMDCATRNHFWNRTPDLFGWKKPVFTNWRDTIVIIVALIVVSMGRFYSGLFENMIVELLLTLLAMVIAFLILRFGGTKELQEKASFNSE
jgi:hypothetical protein